MTEESQNAQDARVETLWKSLHTGPIEPLNLEGLKAGLRKIKHPLATADKLVKQVFEIVDTSRDGKIEYSEFRSFIEQTERELQNLFKTIDVDHNGRLDRRELHAAFKNADIAAEAHKLDRFFDHIDTNNDGEITFEEWRNFLMFLPLDAPNLDIVLSYYDSYVFIGSEGDVSVQANPGIGIHIILSSLFGSLYDLTQYRPPSSQSVTSQHSSIAQLYDLSSDRNDIPWDPGASAVSAAAIVASASEMSQPSKPSTIVKVDHMPSDTSYLYMLTDLLPDAGYFISGGIAGFTSRTATAPLDRLKVYLIAQTGTKKQATDAIKSGNPIKAMKAATAPLVNACVELWRMGGIRSLFAGNGLNVLKVMPESAIKFGSYEASKRVAAKIEGHNNPRALSGLSQFLAAGMGGVISQFAVYPLDTLKFRVQCETVAGGPRGNALILQTARKMVVEGSFRSYYRGLVLGLGGMFPYSAIDLTTYEYLKKAVTAYHVKNSKCSEKAGEPGRMMTGAIGAVSSSFGATIVYPVNLIRTRIQSQGTKIHPPTYTGWRDCFNQTIQREGLKGLYKGLTPNLLKVVPSMSISYMVYETSKKVLGLR